MEGVNCVTQNVKAVAKEMKERAGHAIGEVWRINLFLNN